MANPEEFIEINDFRPGIWSDMHAAPPDGVLVDPADPNVRGYLPGNGAATVENTFGCRVDKTGALIPLPAAFGAGVTPGHIPEDAYTTANRPVNYPAAYLLDAEVSPQRFYVEEGGVPFFLPTVEASSVYTLWGFHFADDGNGVASGYYSYVLGREYRLNAPYEPVYDYLFTRSDIRFGEAGAGGFQGITFPAGSLCLSRLDNGANPTVVANLGVLFATQATTPVMVALVSFNFHGNPYGTNTQSPSPIPVGEQAWLTDYHDTPGSSTTVKRPSTYSLPFVYLSDGLFGHTGNTIVGMSLGTDGYDVGTPHPTDEWTWHHKDDALDTSLHNMPYVPYLLIPHQGRVVMADLTGQRDYFASVENDPTGGSTDEWRMYFSDDIIWYSRWGQPIGDPYTPNATERIRGYIPLQVAEDQVSPIGVLGVVTADELLVVKARGGGALIRGDLDNPTVRRLPHIEPTGGVTSKSAQTPIGHVYGTKTGVFVFDGGDATRKLSRQIDGFFWNPYEEDDIVLEGSYGRFAYWNDMVMVPNNYVYDIESDSWWRWFRGETFPPYSIYIVNNIGQLWAFPYKTTESTAGSAASVFFSYNVDRLSSTYTWQSHPLVETRGRRVSFQDVRLLVTARAAATVAVTLTGFDEEGATIASDSIVLACAANASPQVMREDITPNFSAEYVQVRLEAISTDGAFAAPKVHTVRLGIRPRQRTPRHG